MLRENAHYIPLITNDIFRVFASQMLDIRKNEIINKVSLKTF